MWKYCRRYIQILHSQADHDRMEFVVAGFDAPATMSPPANQLIETYFCVKAKGDRICHRTAAAMRIGRDTLWKLNVARGLHGVGCLKFDVRNCGDLVNAFMQIFQKGSVYKWRTRWDAAKHRVCVICHLSTFWVTVDYTKSYINQEQWCAKALKGGFRNI